MNKHLRDLLDRAETWPPEAQQALEHAANAIEAGLKRSPKPSLRQIMQSGPLDDVDLDRRSVFPEVRDVTL